MLTVRRKGRRSRSRSRSRRVGQAGYSYSYRSCLDLETNARRRWRPTIWHAYVESWPAPASFSPSSIMVASMPEAHQLCPQYFITSFGALEPAYGYMHGHC